MGKAKQSKVKEGLLKATNPTPTRPGGIVKATAGPAPAKRRTADPISVAGAPLRQSERNELDEIANEYGATPASLASTAIRYFMREYRAGRVQLHVKGGQRSKRFYLPDDEED